MADGAFPFRGGWWLILIFDYSANQFEFKCEIVILQLLVKLRRTRSLELPQTRQYFVVTLFGYSVGEWKSVGKVKQGRMRCGAV